MPFLTSPEVSARLQKNPDPLTEEEIRGMFKFANVMSPGDARVLEAQLALLTIQALTKFDQSSAKLAERIYWLTGALVILTVALTVFTVLLWFKG